MKYDKYISTTLPYANSVPHIGHALEFIQADALVRHFGLVRKENVFFNVGIDENGLKIHQTAQEKGFVNTGLYVDALAIRWKQFCSDFDIEYDNFYRTTDPEHKRKVQQFWNECMERGDLYKKKYIGHYCVGCESFKTETELNDDGRCPDHMTAPTVIEEENWFFNIERHKGLVYGWLQYKNAECLSPVTKQNELGNVILNAKDISVSRLKTNVPWGIEVPNDPDQVIYVWFEALLNYIFAVQDFKEQKFIQLCGPDNLRFQGSLLQSILIAANLPCTHKLLVHGTVLDADGRKMSKTLGNVVDPIEQKEKYGLDAVRLYALVGIQTFGNGSWIEHDLINLYNSHLADNFGNLLTRVLHLIDLKQITIVEPDDRFEKSILKIRDDVYESFDRFHISDGLDRINDLLKIGNKYITDERPWEKNKDATQVLGNLYELLCIATDLYIPVLSNETITKIKKALITKKKTIIFPKIL